MFWTEMRIFIMYLLLYSRQLVDRIKLYFGLAKNVYGGCDKFYYKGYRFSGLAHNLERLKACERYDNFRPDDLMILAYPKTGTHFVKETIMSIYKEKGLLPHDTPTAKVVSSFEIKPPPGFQSVKQNGEDFESYLSPRMIATHLPWSLLPPKVKKGKVKIVLVYRNPKDTVCSAFPFLMKLRLLFPDTKFADFIQWFVDGKVDYTGYFQYLKEWYPHRNLPDTLIIQFEDMKKNLKGNVERICNFLNIELSPQQLERVVVANTFENRKKEQGRNHPVYRNGKAGG
ncbi:amine sulfotransferase-like [Watersipora subatra]|uniref:amine sulfotransferase-like n=1 Tax=Watersipora subatra TaxID=2589382 RepID=UPI00355C855F